MKKILFVLSLILTFLLAGCANNKPVGNEDIENQDVVEQNVVVNEAMSAEEKYKISDNYFVSGEKLKDEECILGIFPISEDDFYKESCVVDSDGMQFEITCVPNKYDSEDLSTSLTYDVRINGEKIKSNNDTFPNLYGKMWVVDLDENDQYKEIVLFSWTGVDSTLEILRLTKNSIQVFFEIDGNDADLMKIGDRWICTNYIEISNPAHSEERITFGYYIYEDGTFKYIDRFATGEKILDENGLFPSNFQNIIFTENFSVNYDGKVAYFSGKCNLLSMKTEIDDYNKEYNHYNIRLLEDIEVEIYSDDGSSTKEIWKAGKNIENCEYCYPG